MKTKIMAALMAVAVLTVATSSADAQTYRDTPLNTMTPQERMDYYAQGSQENVPVSSRRARRSYEGEQIVAHPAGCPRRLFCGCGVSVKVFGRPIKDLFLAANWVRKFPRAAPGSGMVAARSGHVMYIISYLGDNMAQVYDPNSGGHKTRIHTRSLAGYRVVDPHGVRVASR